MRKRLLLILMALTVVSTAIAFILPTNSGWRPWSADLGETISHDPVIAPGYDKDVTIENYEEPPANASSPIQARAVIDGVPGPWVDIEPGGNHKFEDLDDDDTIDIKDLGNPIGAKGNSKLSTPE